MHHKLSVFAVIVALLLGAVMVGGRSVSAAPGNGNSAQTGGDQINVNDCSNDYDGNTICFVAQGEYHYVYTAAGGFNGQANFRNLCFTVSDEYGNVLFQVCAQNNHLQFHTDKASDVQVLRVSVGDGSVTIDGNPCYFSGQFHEANGQLQYDTFTSTC